MENWLITQLIGLCGLIFIIASPFCVLKALFAPDPLGMCIDGIEHDMAAHRKAIAEAEAFLTKLRSSRG